MSRALRFDELTLTEPTITWRFGRQPASWRLPDNVRDLLNTFDSVQIRNATLISEIAEGDTTRLSSAFAGATRHGERTAAVVR